MRTQWLLASLVSALLVAGCASVDGVGENGLPTPERLVDRYIEAAYGDKGVDGYPSITMEGRLVIDQFGIDEPIIVQSEAPDKSFFKTNVMGADIVRVCSGERCWSQEFGGALREVDGAELEFYRQASDFHRFENFDDYYASAATTQLTRFADENAYEVALTRDDGSQDKWYFAEESGLLLGMTLQVPVQGGVEVTQYMDNYQDFGGIKLPTEMTEVSSMSTSKTVISDVRFEDIPDSVFDAPK